MRNQKPPGPMAEVYLLLVALIWGTTFVLVKNGLAFMGAFTFNGLRFLIAFLTLALFFPSFFRLLDRELIKKGALVGLFMMLGYSFQTLGLSYTTATNAGFITGLSVVLVPVIYSFMTFTFPGSGGIIGVFCAGAGLYLMSFGTTHHLVLSYGDILELLGAISFAMQIVFVSRYSPRFRAFPFTMVQILVVGLLSILVALFFEEVPLSYSSGAVWSLLLTAIPATAVAFLVQNSMQKHTTPTRTAIIFTTEPVFSAVFAHFYAGEALNSATMLGGALILFGMLVAELWGSSG